MRTVKNEESGMHSGSQLNVMWSHEFWPALYPCDWLKVFRRNTLRLSSRSRSQGVTTQNTAYKYHRQEILNN